jgi:hypothetical protein
VPQITNSQSISSHLTGVTRSDASLSCPYKGICQLSFPKPVYSLMQVKEKMCPVRDQYPSITTDSIRFKTINFSK